MIREPEMSSAGYPEPLDETSAETGNVHRAIVSLMEERQP